MKSGRKSKFKPDMLKDAELLCGLGFTQEDLATYWNTTPETVSRWARKYHTELYQAIRQGKLNADASAVRKLYEKVQEGNLTAILYWIAKRRPDLWPERLLPATMITNIQQQQIKDKSQQSINIIFTTIINSMSPQERIAVIGDLEKLEYKLNAIRGAGSNQRPDGGGEDTEQRIAGSGTSTRAIPDDTKPQ